MVIMLHGRGLMVHKTFVKSYLLSEKYAVTFPTDTVVGATRSAICSTKAVINLTLYGSEANGEMLFF